MGRKSNVPERREQIVWALYACLTERGHEKVTIKEIANKAKLPAGVIHYYFKNKDEIISTLAEVLIKKYSDEIQAHLGRARSSARQIEYAIDFTIEHIVFNPPLNRVFYNLIQMVFERPELDSVVKALFQDYRGKLISILEKAGAGRDSKMIGTLLVATIEGLSLQLMVDPGAFKKAAVTRMLKQQVRRILETP